MTSESYHPRHHHVLVGLALLLLELLLSVGQLCHQVVDLVVEIGGVLEGFFRLLFGLGGALRGHEFNHSERRETGELTQTNDEPPLYLLHITGYPLGVLRLALCLSSIDGSVAQRLLCLPGLLVGGHDSGVDDGDLLQGFLCGGLVVVDPLIKICRKSEKKTPQVDEDQSYVTKTALF